VSGSLSAFTYLTARSLRNRAVAQLRRLKSPRYVLFLAVGCAYLLLLLHRPADAGVDVVTPLTSSRPGGVGGVQLLSTCALALLAAKWWLFGSANAALAFSPAEVQLLFPAPITRRTLVLYKISRSQLALLVSAVVITILARRAGAQLAPPLRVVSVWVLFCTLSLHQMATALVRAGAAERGRGLRRNALPVLVVGAAVLVLLFTAVGAWPGVRGIDDIPHAMTQVWMAFRSPLPNAVLAPFRIAIAPSYAETSRAWLLAIGPAVALLAVHVLWVLRADAVFEDAAVEASARHAAQLAEFRARKAGVALPTPRMVDKISGSMAAVRLERPGAVVNRPRHAPFPLDPTGDPAVAILWKNTVALLRGLRLRTGLWVSFSLAAFMIATRELGLLPGSPTSGGLVLLGTLAFIAAMFLLVLGPVAVRNDLRQDLLHIDMLRAFPLRGPTLVFAEIASSTLALTLVQWALLAVSYVCLASTPIDEGGGPLSLFPMSFPSDLAMFAVAIAILPLINGASFLIQNAAALLFPEWARIGSSSMGGLEAVGQRLLGFAASLVALTAILAPPAIAVGGILVALSRDGMPSRGTLLAAVCAGLAIGATEIYVAVLWLGHRFERTDASVIQAGSG
jgi:hypothetical protein